MGLKPVRFVIFLLLLFSGAAGHGQWVAETPLKPSSGVVLRFSQFPSEHVTPRTIDVWLPEGYNRETRYSVLYMHDGQMLYDSTVTWNGQEWGLDETAGSLIKSGKTRPFIIVGIWNTPLRYLEYLPEKPWLALTPEEKSVVKAYRRPGMTEPTFPDKPVSDEYLLFLVKELKPAIDSTFSTLPDRDHTFLAGSSMGGLISLYGVCEYPDVFGGAACLSTHWTGLFRATDNPLPDVLLGYLAGHSPAPKNHRLYFDHGTEALDSLYAPFQQRADNILRNAGYSSTNLMTRSFPGEDHSERAWQRRMKIPLVFLFGN